MKHSILALALMVAACGGEAPGDPQATAQQADAPAAGSGGQSASAGDSGDSGGTAGQPSKSAPNPNIDKLMGPCGPAHCPTDVFGWNANPGAYGCYEGVCTFRCGPHTVDAAAAYCASLGGVCQGTPELLTCQR